MELVLRYKPFFSRSAPALTRCPAQPLYFKTISNHMPAPSITSHTTTPKSVQERTQKQTTALDHRTPPIAVRAQDCNQKPQHNQNARQ